MNRRTVDGVQDSTVNKELKHLLAAFNFGRKQTPKKVSEVPYLPMVACDNVRQGLLEIGEYRRLLNCLPDSLKLFLVLAYHSGCRKSELTNLIISGLKFGGTCASCNSNPERRRTTKAETCRFTVIWKNGSTGKNRYATPNVQTASTFCSGTRKTAKLWRGEMPVQN